MKTDNNSKDNELIRLRSRTENEVKNRACQEFYVRTVLATDHDAKIERHNNDPK
jgi:hypothetical protein